VAGGESAKELKQRAETLRDAARRARQAASGLGSYLDGPVKKATATGKDRIWTGSWAEETTTALQARGSTLHTMASALLTDAKRWVTEAEKLEERAKHAKGGQ
jgi:hypothetical protein